MVFVLAVECSKYAGVVDGAGDEILVGCRCALCGGSDLRLTGSRVERQLETGVDRVTLEVALARCRSCQHRERVLPCDVLPGRVIGVEFVLATVRDVVLDGASQASVAERRGVVTRTVLAVAGDSGS